MRRPSYLTRVLRTLTALSTVWCLGCNAFDPLIAGLFSEPGARMMVCASEESVPTAVGQMAPLNQAPSVSVPAADPQGSEGATCGCSSCHAPVPTSFAVAAPLPPLPRQSPTDIIAPPSVERAPLVPPPQRSA
jgi:hypothetical protein